MVPKDDINRLADRDRLDRFLAILDRLEGAADPATSPDELAALARER